MGGVVRVDAAGLDTWAVQCATAAADLALCRPAIAGVPSGQATAAAVSASHTIAATAGRVLGARLHDTGTRASIAATSYVESDDNSAHRLAEVSASVLV